MSNVGQAVLSIGGAGIGFLIGGPFGAQVGYLIGSGAGQLLFPTDLGNIKGPRLNDLTIQTSTIGAPIPIVYGTFALAGNVIWSGGLIEVVNEDEQGGKGGGPSQTVTTYTYFVDVAVGICEGEIQAIRKIWADAKVIYDLSPQAADETDEAYAERLAASAQTAELMTVYVGSETQLADPTIESYEVAGSVPGFRGLAYVVFDQLPLADYGNRIPNFRFEVVSGTAAAEDCTQYSAGQLFPWVEDNRDPRNSDNTHIYYGDANSGYTTPIDEGTEAARFQLAVDDLSADLSRTFLTNNIYGWTTVTTGGPASVCRGTATNDRVRLYLKVNSCDISEMHCEQLTNTGSPGSDSQFAFDFKNNFGIGNTVWWDGDWYLGEQGSGLWVRANAGESASTYFCGETYSSVFAAFAPTGGVFRLTDQEIGIERQVSPPDGCDTPLAGAPGFCIDENGNVVQAVTWVLTSGTFKVLQPYDTAGGLVTSYPVNPCLPLGDDNYDDQAYWEAAYAEALANGENIAGGLVYGVDYPVVVSEAYVGECSAESIEAECVPIALIIQDICERAGLTAVDVAGITGTIHGYAISRVMSARDALSPLRTVGLFDAVESGEELKFVERGGAAVATITEDDLCAHSIESDRPPAVETTRIQEKELPRRVRLHYASQDRNYEPGEQSASRITTEAVTEQDVEVAVALCEGDEEAAQLSEILLYDAWVSRNTYRFALDNSWLRLEPTDCLLLPVDDQLERVRILSVDYSIGGILQIEAVRDDDGSYVSTAVPSEPSPSGSQSGAGSSLVCPSEIVLLDIPRLRESDTDAGYYAGVYGLCSGWTCAGVYRSADDGNSYRRVGTTNTQATIGNVVDFVFETGGDTSDTSGIDHSFVLTVELDYGTLSSTTTGGLFSGVNTAAIGAHGRWEIIQFLEATFDTGNTWELRGLRRGLLDTEDNSDLVVAGDRFVLLSGPGIFRIPEECSQAGITKLIKTPTCGESLAAVEAESFTTAGLSCSQAPISPDPPDLDTSTPAADCTHLLIWNTETGQYEPAPLYLQQICNVQFDSTVQVGDVLSYVGEDTSGPLFGFIPQAGDTSDSGSGGVDSVTGLGGVTVDNTDPANPVVSITAGDRGDITTSGTGGTTWTIDNDAVTYAKIQDVTTTDRVLGRDSAGSGIIEELTLSQVLDMIGSAAQGDILYRDASAWARLAAGTSGFFLKTNGAAANPAWSSIAATAGGAMTYLGQNAVAGAAATTITVSGLDLDTVGMYFFRATLDNATGGNINITLTFNSDTTAGNYDNEAVGASGASLGSTGSNNAQILGSLATGDTTTIMGWITPNFDGAPCAFLLVNSINNATRIARWIALQWRTSTNLTQFVLTSSVASGFSIGSAVRTWSISV